MTLLPARLPVTCAVLALALVGAALAAADPAVPSAAAGASGSATAPAPMPLLIKPGDHVAICGDSITEQRIYSRYIAEYLLACSGVPDLDVAQFGWSGETAQGFALRLDKSLAWYKPTVATMLYGMNDGRYIAFSDDAGNVYRDNMGKCLDSLKGLGARSVLVSSPGAVDTTSFNRPCGPSQYNDTLNHLGNLGEEVAKAHGQTFVDTHQDMVSAMFKAKNVLGQTFLVCGKDGVHPDNDGHLVMMASLLEGLGCDGAIARVQISPDGKAEVGDGHTVVASSANGAASVTVDLESRRWPFVLGAEGKTPQNLRSIAPFIDFTTRLDRFIVIMPACPWTKARLTWGDQTVTVDGAQLRFGVNLMDLFSATPFDKQADALDQAVGRLQAFETSFVKGVLNYNGGEIDADPQSKALFDQLIARQIALRNEKFAGVKALLVPVRHRIVVAKAD
jgi:lysophospholipase L1-like esterase